MHFYIERLNELLCILFQGCGRVPDMDKGTVTLEDPSNTKAGATASVKCNYGFKALTLSITCLQNGEWETPVCKKISMFVIVLLITWVT